MMQTASDRWRLGSLLLVYAALWMMLTPYAGLSHDAQAYALQAMARIDPTVYGGDIFLRFNSQDRFTIFPQIYAWAIGWLGLESTALTLTLLLQCAWYAAGFLIGRQLFGTKLAWLVLGLLIALPGPYGGQRVFHIAEPFLSARLPAESLCLLAVWAWLASRRHLAVALLAAAMLVHPLMAFPAALLVSLSAIDAGRPFGLTTARTVPLIFGGALAGSWLLGQDTAVMPPDWVQSLRERSGFLFLSRWQLADWNQTIITMASLWLSSLALRDDNFAGSRLAAACWSVAATGLALAAVCGELWHLRILLEGQPWRWVWLARFLAIALLPATIQAAWQGGSPGRAVAFLLASAWLSVLPISNRSPFLVVLGAVFALAALGVWLAKDKLPQSTSALLLKGGYACIALVLVGAASTAALSAAVVQPDIEMLRATQRTLRILSLITPAALVAVAAWYLAIRARGMASGIACLAAGIALMAVAGPYSAQRWSDRSYSDANVARFADWRALIPADSEVFWWNGLREVWFLLQRRSYLTVSQGAGMVFSEQLADEFRRRAESAAEFIDPGIWFNRVRPGGTRPFPLTARILEQTCRDPALGFIVSTDAIGTGIPAKEWPTAGRHVYLYDCRLYRPAGTGTDDAAATH